jgi:hypothetical protein
LMKRAHGAQMGDMQQILRFAEKIKAVLAVG